MSQRKAAVGDTIRLKVSKQKGKLGQVEYIDTLDRWGTRWTCYGHWLDYLSSLRYKVLVDTQFGPILYSLGSADFDLVRKGP